MFEIRHMKKNTRPVNKANKYFLNHPSFEKKTEIHPPSRRSQQPQQSQSKYITHEFQNELKKKT